MRFEDFEHIKAKNKEEKDRRNKDILILSTTIEQLLEIIKWCGETFPELQEGGEYWSTWESVEDMLESTKKKTKEHKAQALERGVGPFG